MLNRGGSQGGTKQQAVCVFVCLFVCLFVCVFVCLFDCLLVGWLGSSQNCARFVADRLLFLRCSLFKVLPSQQMVAGASVPAIFIPNREK